MLTRYALEMRKEKTGETLVFILVVHSPEALHHIQRALEKDGWIMVEWRPVNL